MSPYEAKKSLIMVYTCARLDAVLDRGVDPLDGGGQVVAVVCQAVPHGSRGRGSAAQHGGPTALTNSHATRHEAVLYYCGWKRIRNVFY